MSSQPEPSSVPSSGLLAWLEETRVALPLKGVEARFHVFGDVVEVTLDQIYHQDRDRPLDVTYTFPLPDGAAVHRCELHVNGRVIAARVRPVEEARGLAREWSARGHRTVLVESVRSNLFELGLGNLAPGDTVVVRLGYFQTVETDGAEAAQFRIPLTPGIRYVAGEPLLRRNAGTGSEDDTDLVPDASRLSPPRIDADHPDAAYLACEGTVERTGWDAAAITSPSHVLLVQDGDPSVAVHLRLASRAEVPDRDVVVRLRADRSSGSDALPAAAWAGAEPDPGPGEATRFRHVLARIVSPAAAGETGAAVTPRDFFFLIDRSGSMEGVKWSACCRALRQFLGSLTPLDRAWVTFFESSFQDLAEKPLPAAAILAEPVIGNLEKLGTGGGTELHQALVHVLGKLDRHSAPERFPSLVLVTDGQVGDEGRIHELLERRTSPLPVHALGIDTAVNDAFLKRIADASGGSCVLASPSDDIVGLVTGLARRTRLPAVSSFRIDGPWESAEAVPAALWQDDAVTLALRAPWPAPDVVTVCGTGPDGGAVSWTILVRPTPGEAPRLLWHRRRIRFLERQGRQVAADEVAREANLLSAGTAFVAWDEAERIVLQGANALCHQPSLDPDGWCAQAAPMAAPRPWVLLAGMGGMGKSALAKSAVTGAIKRFAPPPSVQEEPAPIFLSRSRAVAADWTTALPVWLGLPEEDAIRFVDWLEQWLWSDPNRREERERDLEAWWARHRDAADDPSVRREAFLGWFGSGSSGCDPTILQAVAGLLRGR
jgi:Ca-activated chloride channel family protein